MQRPIRLFQYAYILKNYVFQQRQPFLASFKITYRCNLTCQQCPFYNLESTELSYEQACTTLDILYQRGNRMVIFEGGEPYLWKDGEYHLADLVNYARRLFFSVGITTNGTLPLHTTADVLWVSLDGLTETHNRLRGAPIFERVLHNIQACQHPRLYAHITINAINAAEIPHLVRFLNGKVRGITIQFYYPYNRQDALFLDFERRATLLDELILLKHSGLPILNSTAALHALKRNTWRCDDHLIDNANPDGTFSQGCYLKNRTDIDCSKCGFSPHTEISLACRGNVGSILAGRRIFFLVV
ncbi:MAG: hypothetical protein CVU39_11760 [Chloroflexi bacterium HGW-Chloroflexi-10]|nr:MAG: hypothetical protein CVU39_11760 [Chloroflexi bacterium HGW-Chloroflexi-10]